MARTRSKDKRRVGEKKRNRERKRDHDDDERRSRRRDADDGESSWMMCAWTLISLATIVSILVFLGLAIFSGGDGDGAERRLEDMDEGANEEDVDEGAYEEEMDEQAYEEEKDEQAYEEANEQADDEAEDNGGGQRRSWNFSYTLARTEYFSLISMLLIVLVLAPYGCSALRKIGSKSARFQVGVFAAAILMYANLALFFMTFLGFNQSKENAEALLPISALAILWIAIAFVYIIFGFVVYKAEGLSFIADRPSEPFWKSDKKAVTDLLYRVWCFLCAISVLALIASLVLIIIGERSGNNGGGRNKDDNSEIKGWMLYVAWTWSVVLIVIFSKTGEDSLGARGYPTQLLIGSFAGGLTILSCFFFAEFYISSPFTLLTGGGDYRGGDGEQQEEGRSNLASTAFSFTSLLLSILHGIFAVTVFLHQETIIVANAIDSGVWFRKPILAEQEREVV